MGISEKKMKIVIENYFKAECNINTTIHDAFEKGFRIGVQKGISAQPTPHWIPCSERLPYAEYGESDNVLATCGHRNVEGGIIRWVRTLYFNGGNWCYPTGETYLEKVYAWMPLPEPYMRGEQDAEIR